MSKTAWKMTARPIPSILAYPYEAERLKGGSVAVRFECGKMGRINRNKMVRMAMAAVEKKSLRCVELAAFHLVNRLK